jgi:uncharacterized protein (TIGR00106 family)
MGTIVEAESLNKLFELAEKMHEKPFNKDVKRVVTTIKIDDRRDKKLSIQGKLNSVYNKVKDSNG